MIKKYIFAIFIIFVLITGTLSLIQETAAQSESSSSDIQPVMIGQVNVASLPTLENQSQSFEIPYLTIDPESFSEIKAQQKDIQTAQSITTSINSPSSVVEGPIQTAELNIFSGFENCPLI